MYDPLDPEQQRDEEEGKKKKIYILIYRMKSPGVRLACRRIKSSLSAAALASASTAAAAAVTFSGGLSTPKEKRNINHFHRVDLFIHECKRAGGRADGQASERASGHACMHIDDIYRRNDSGIVR
jgi:hypothetical protein